MIKTVTSIIHSVPRTEVPRIVTHHLLIVTRTVVNDTGQIVGVDEKMKPFIKGILSRS